MSWHWHTDEITTLGKISVPEDKPLDDFGFKPKEAAADSIPPRRPDSPPGQRG